MSEQSIARFREALDRRAEAQEQLRQRLAQAASLREYLDIQHADRSEALQTAANTSYSSIKRRK
jgi:hypothetical protein